MKRVILYTMKVCPHCKNLKEQLIQNNIEFEERDVDKYNKQYERFVEITKNEYLPAFILYNLKEGSTSRMTPDNDFETIEEAVDKIKKFIL